jgi:tetratricopeptide (TPR) repeat protein
MKTRIFILILLAARFLPGLAQAYQVQKAMRDYRYREAIALLERAPESVENELLKAECYQKLYDYPAALDIYESLIAGNHETIRILTAAADCATQAGDHETSLRYWLKACELSPGNLYLQTKKVVAFYRADDWQGTIQASEEVFRQDTIPMLLRLVGDAHMQLGDEVGLLYYMKALEMNPADHVTLRKLCDFYYSAQLYDSVISLTDHYLAEIDPDRKTIGQLNGMAYYVTGDYKKAIDRLKRNTALGDTTYTTTYFLGMSYYASKLYFNAAKWLGLAYDQAPQKDVNLLLYYGTSLARSYDRKKGIEILNEGVEMIEKVQEMLFDFDLSLADAHHRSNAPSKAIEYYQSAWKRSPQTYSVLYNIAIMYDEMEELESALTYYERFLKTAPAGTDVDPGPANQSDLEQMTTMQLFYRAAAQRVQELKKAMFFKK